MIVWGTRAKFRRVGRVADFCPVCRTPQAFHLIRIGIASHLYFISIGQGTLHGYESRCEGCGGLWPTDGRRYRHTSGNEELGIDELMERTFPGLAEAYADELATARLVAAGKCPATARTDLLYEPMIALNYGVERQVTHREYGPIQRRIGWATLGVLIVLLLFMYIYPEGAGERFLLQFFAITFLALFAASAYCLLTAMGSYLGRVTIPALARSLAPLEPTQGELAAALLELKKRGLRIGRKVKAKRLYRAIEELNVFGPR